MKTREIVGIPVQPIRAPAEQADLDQMIDIDGVRMIEDDFLMQEKGLQPPPTPSIELMDSTFCLPLTADKGSLSGSALSDSFSRCPAGGMS